MEFSTALAADLAALTEALDDTTDIATTLHRLAADAGLAVPSYLGLSVAISTGAQPVTLTAMREFVRPTDVRTSLSVTLPLTEPHPDSLQAIKVILYAATPGAFVDLAADLTWLSSFGHSQVSLDHDLQPACDPDTRSALGDISTINQAIGVLIARGATPARAQRDLEMQAARAGLDRRSVAATLLNGLDDRGIDT